MPNSGRFVDCDTVLQRWGDDIVAAKDLQAVGDGAKRALSTAEATATAKRHPQQGPVSRGSTVQSPIDQIDQTHFRAVMRHQAASVAIVAAAFEGNRAGLTATSVCSLSDDPPTLLVCLNLKSSLHDIARAAKRFSVNLLASDQQELAQLFAGATGISGDARFDDARCLDESWCAPPPGTPPLLPQALASLDCALTDIHECATHTIFIGTVLSATARDTADPLIYFRGNYCTMGQET